MSENYSNGKELKGITPGQREASKELIEFVLLPLLKEYEIKEGEDDKAEKNKLSINWINGINGAWQYFKKEGLISEQLKNRIDEFGEYLLTLKIRPEEIKGVRLPSAEVTEKRKEKIREAEEITEALLKELEQLGLYEVK